MWINSGQLNNKKAVLLQRKPHDAAVNYNRYQVCRLVSFFRLFIRRPFQITKAAAIGRTDESWGCYEKQLLTMTGRKLSQAVFFSFDTRDIKYIPEMLLVFYTKSNFFQYPTPILAKILTCSLWNRCWGLQTAKANQPWNYFQSIPAYVTTLPQRYRQMDRWLSMAILYSV